MVSISKISLFYEIRDGWICTWKSLSFLSLLIEQVWDIMQNRSGMTLKFLDWIKIGWDCHFRRREDKAVGRGHVSSPSSPSPPGNCTFCSSAWDVLLASLISSTKVEAYHLAWRFPRGGSFPLSRAPTAPMVRFPFYVFLENPMG